MFSCHRPIVSEQLSNSHPLDPLTRLMSLLRSREQTRPPGSYTTRLMEGGVEAVAAKIREEAEEMIEAAIERGSLMPAANETAAERPSRDERPLSSPSSTAASQRSDSATQDPSQHSAELEQRDHLIYEAGDLIYHTLVLLAKQRIDLSEVAAELARREGTSGLAKKRAEPIRRTDSESFG